MGFDGEKDIRCCKNCGELIWNTETEVCPKCGKSVPKNKENVIQAKTCPKCRALSTLDTCVICGEKLEHIPTERVHSNDPRWC